MNDNDLTKAILNVFKKELGSLGDILPSKLLSSITKKISPEIEGLVEKSGYVTKSKYESLERLAQELEKRIIDLEKSL
jgi:polyhydroxyalkanoate synthesis regulator phasin|tara:strand:- start:923 stop:1156 length:234 start_codon:yes stop_codon:yes gene_type:complete